MLLRTCVIIIAASAVSAVGQAVEITSLNQPAQLDIRAAGANSVRVTLKPRSFQPDFPNNPALAEREYEAPAIRIRELSAPIKAKVGGLNVEVLPGPLAVAVMSADGKPIQRITFEESGNLAFELRGQPVLGLGEGGPLPRGNFRTLPIEFDRRGILDDMRPRWQSDAYGSRNPVALFIGTEGWGLYIATPWGQVDLRDP